MQKFLVLRKLRLCVVCEKTGGKKPPEKVEVDTVDFTDSGFYRYRYLGLTMHANNDYSMIFLLLLILD